MIGFIDALTALHTRGTNIDAQDYLFSLMITVGEDKEVAYVIAYDNAEWKRVLGTEDENDYLATKAKDVDALLKQQHIIQLNELIQESYRAEIQKSALNLTDYKFSGEETIKILNSLLKNRVEDIDSASVKDVVAVIKMLTEQGALESGDGGFGRHFVQIFPHFNVCCVTCGREFDIVRGVHGVCPHCGQHYQYSENEDRFYPQPIKL